ncbi:macro domain-containing protein [uncultured Megasphaera sp.]|uniref:macro domain-containing protein n=1 Tax=uncultured Megasphaera sp. TaxID=165188 RepID=UPI002594E5F0|nr:macro domain-containing protein [uncultured Megasphaera sp.]
MKVQFLSKNLWKEYYSFISKISVITSLAFLFFEIPVDVKLRCGGIFIVFLIGRFLYIWCRANHLQKISLQINNSTLEIESGDIFSENGFKIIAFNEFFDTQVDDVIISKNTLNGQYITRYYPRSSDLDNIIDSDVHLTECIIGTRERRAGKEKQYKLGTIVKNGEYFLLAFTHFDKDNRAFLGVNDYISCLMNMWDECDILYGGNTVVLPLLGSGITRFRGNENISDQELLEIIIWTFKVSRIRFQYPAKAKIILTENCLHKINLYDVKKRFDS